MGVWLNAELCMECWNCGVMGVWLNAELCMECWNCEPEPGLVRLLNAVGVGSISSYSSSSSSKSPSNSAGDGGPFPPPVREQSMLYCLLIAESCCFLFVLILWKRVLSCFAVMS